MGVDSVLSAPDFYERCIDGKLSEKDFTIKTDGSTIQKSHVSTELMSIHKRSTMYGESGLLYTEKLLGNIRGCIGHKKSKNHRFHYPNTLLETDIRNKSAAHYPVLAVYQKLITEPLYNIICYKSKILRDVDYNKLVWENEISQIIDIESLISDI
jgi:hypothetical protein